MSFKRRLEQALCNPKMVERIRCKDISPSGLSQPKSGFSNHPSFLLYGKGFSQKSVSVPAKPSPVDGFIPLTHISTGYYWIGDTKLREHPRRSVHIRGFEASSLISGALWERVTGWDKSSLDDPLTNVGWLDAVLFCNAYSRMQFLDPAYKLPAAIPFHLPHALQLEVLPQIKVDLSRTGFRLPSELEWECLMKEKLSKSMVAKDGNSIQYQEWCSDEYGTMVPDQDENPTYTSIWRSVRGGTSSMKQQKRLLERSQMLGYQSSDTIAFRIVRTRL